ncbi:hypothetical protein [Cochleicola gelatinilyticus]|uniref:Outer membrane protein beta-barrel domain-containing protein n=1 Tax=Cochleicola gelatinilyticus TaxID=1763537 RepID=A0A167K8E9_9FLAO|nr:hypothetical protein [Cochleicola gelatinilyticus]OAB81495.1 hypothetical protein ULVI_01360 [Cochleicola gelatinilyticus]
MKYILSVLLLLFIFTVHAQENSSENSIQNTAQSYITANLLVPFGPYTPRFRVGYIQVLSPRYRAGIDIGYGNESLSFLAIGDNAGNDYKLFEIRPEFYFILNPTRKGNHYISAEAFYLYQEETPIDDNYQSEATGNYVQFDRADFERKKYGLHIKYGVFFPFTESFGGNAYAGVGFKVRDNTYSNVINPRSNEDYFNDFAVFERYREYEGVETNIDFSLGFKLYYSFN